MTRAALDEARRKAEEALAQSTAHNCSNDDCDKPRSCFGLCEEALRVLLAATAKEGACTKARDLLSSAKHYLRSDSPMRAAIDEFLATPDSYAATAGDAPPRPAPDAVAEAAERCANDGCGCVRSEPDPDGIGVRILWCPDRWPGDADLWCWSCQMRAAFDAAAGEVPR